MVDFLGTFPTLSGPPPQSLEELSDGVVLFEVLSEMYVPSNQHLCVCVCVCVCVNIFVFLFWH